MSDPPCTPRPSGRTEDQDVDEITVQLRDCNIRVRLSPGGRASSSPSAQVFSSAASSAGFSVVTEGDSARVRLAEAELFGLDLLELTSPQDLDKIDLKHLESLARTLASLCGGWTSRARVARAIRAPCWCGSKASIDRAARCFPCFSISACEEEVLHCSADGSPNGGLLDGELPYLLPRGGWL